MNFYEHQDRARRRTLWLVTCFGLAIVSIIVALNAVALVAVNASARQPVTLQAWLAGSTWAWIAAGVVGVISAGSIYTTLRLSGGGPALADMVGARRVDPATADPGERRLQNVVEEMSIASGTPVPALYVLDDEPGINAFVAGTRPSETVMVVTRGALETFDRQELQGVVAHEYSHIFNNDMSLNLSLMGVLAGLMLMAQIGRLMLRSGAHGRSRNSGQFALLGIAVLVIGYIGLFFGKLIQAAVSRQREFLADASAVQFTRDNQGIASALWKIGQAVDGSLLANRHAEDLGHFCFGTPVQAAFAGLLATHPPIAARIAAVNPGFRPLPTAPGVAMPAAGASAADGLGTSGFAAGNATAAAAPTWSEFEAGSVAAPPPAAVADSVGTLSPRQVAFGQALVEKLPVTLHERLHQREGALQVLCALLVNAAARGAHDTVYDLVQSHRADLVAGLPELVGAVRDLPPAARLPLAQLAMPSLKLLEAAERRRVVTLVKSIIVADRQFTVFEFALLCLLRDHLADAATRKPPVRFFDFAAVDEDLRLLLSVLARHGHGDEAAAAAAYLRAWRPFGFGDGGLLAREACTMSALGRSLERLARLSPLLKKNVIQAAADCVIDDGRITVAEGELLQAIALTLDCPLPPLI
ncbi:MAG: M48 family metallopeptidase [Gammaproteobacteria bacterium]|nr:M48 family metallopeptidase [Gammaproteobacteria bacterium]